MTKAKKEKTPAKSITIRIPHKYIWGRDSFMVRAITGPLHGEQRRKRHEFYKLVNSHVETIEAARIEMLQGYANKDKKGTVIMVDGKFDIPTENMGKFDTEFSELMEANWEIVVDNSNRSLLSEVAKIISKSTYKTNHPAEDEAFIYLQDEFSKVL